MGGGVEGFLPLAEWLPFLQSLPDQSFAAFLARGIGSGFRIGVDRNHQLQAEKSNRPSARKNEGIVSAYIQEEFGGGKLRLAAPNEVVHVSPIAIIPKTSQPGKYRLIVDLSAPDGSSVNDGISPALATLSYTSVDEAVAMVIEAGQSAWMAKLDIQSAYRKVPVHPADQPLLGIHWRGVTFCDRALPFGLRSAPLLFTAVADGLSWAMECCGVHNLIHYLDDFFFCSRAESSECEQALRTAVNLCQRLGLPAAPHKVVGPCTTITFLGIEIDSCRWELRLPEDKQTRLMSILQEWKHDKRQSVTKKQLQSLVGLLNYAARIVRPGRPFTRSLIEASKIPQEPDHWVRLNVECRSDISWWQEFLRFWNGRSFYPGRPWAATVYSDASGRWGCGAVCLPVGQWFQVQWPESWYSISIAAKELLPIVVSVAVWGREWAGLRVLSRCDNDAVVACLRSGSAKDPLLAHLLKILALLSALHKIQLVAVHVAGRSNGAADALSRGNSKLFFSLIPQASRAPRTVPAQLLELLWDREAAWTSEDWMQRLDAFLLLDFQEEQRAPMAQQRGGTCSSASGPASTHSQ
uniref:Reverse transcriptase domain-containing protein n=1 Tax=Amphimedon queenslandica TaxID=400682 RepID=A0A1X7TD39_AMPQE